MRLYDFRCNQCGGVFEELVETTEAEVRCPACGSGQATRQLSSFGIGRSSGSSPSRVKDAGGGGFGGGCSGGLCGL